MCVTRPYTNFYKSVTQNNAHLNILLNFLFCVVIVRPTINWITKVFFKIKNLLLNNVLTHFSPVSHFYTPENVRKPMVF